MIQEKTGVLLVNTGSPAAPTPQAVGAYLSEFLMDGAVSFPCQRCHGGLSCTRAYCL